MTGVFEPTPPELGRKWLSLDSDNLLGAASSLPDQLGHALESPPKLEELAEHGPFRHVVVAGMGGSGIAGRVLKALADERSDVPIALSTGYELPRFVGPATLVVAISFSGGTEETISVARAAIERGAKLWALTGGGALEALARDAGAPVERLPEGIPQPRAAAGAMIASLLLGAEALGFLPGVSGELAEAAAQLRRRVAECEAGSGVAAEVARRIGRTFPLLHGASGLGEVAARRWKTQVNENAKAPAFAGEQPEVCHNELCAFGQGGDVTRQLLTLVNLRLGSEHRQVARRFDLFGELTKEALAGVVDVIASGGGDLARFFDLVMIGDFVSLHLAARDGIDPGPVPILREMKSRLAGER